MQGPNGLYDPWVSGKPINRVAKRCYVALIHDNLQCDIKNPGDYCLYSATYADKTTTRGALVEDTVTIKLSNGTNIQTTLTFG